MKQRLMARLVVLAILVLGVGGTVTLVSTYSGQAPKVVVEGNYIEAPQPPAPETSQETLGSGTRFGREETAPPVRVKVQSVDVELV